MSMLDTVLARQAGGASKLDALQKNNSAAVLNERLGGFKGQAAGAIDAAKVRGAENQATVQNALQDRYKQSIDVLDKRLGQPRIADKATDAELAALNNMIGMGANSMGVDLVRSPTPPPPPPPPPIAAAEPKVYEQRPNQEERYSGNEDGAGAYTVGQDDRSDLEKAIDYYTKKWS